MLSFKHWASTYHVPWAFSLLTPQTAGWWYSWVNKTLVSVKRYLEALLLIDGNRICVCLPIFSWYQCRNHSEYISLLILSFAQLIGGWTSTLFWIFLVPSFASASATSLPVKSLCARTYFNSTVLCALNKFNFSMHSATILDLILKPAKAAKADCESEKIVILFAK